jgi:hypothetical protein
LGFDIDVADEVLDGADQGLLSDPEVILEAIFFLVLKLLVKDGCHLDQNGGSGYAQILGIRVFAAADAKDKLFDETDSLEVRFSQNRFDAFLTFSHSLCAVC